MHLQWGYSWLLCAASPCSESSHIILLTIATVLFWVFLVFFATICCCLAFNKFVMMVATLALVSGSLRMHVRLQKNPLRILQSNKLELKSRTFLCCSLCQFLCTKKYEQEATVNCKKYVIYNSFFFGVQSINSEMLWWLF